MKTVNYFGREVVVPDWTNYLAFEKTTKGEFALYAYTDEPYWDKTLKMWNTHEQVSLYSQRGDVNFLQELRANGIKPSNSLVKLHG